MTSFTEGITMLLTPDANEQKLSHDLLIALKSFCFPGGEGAARRVRAIKTTQSGEIRSAPKAPWVSFTAEEITSATESSFRWQARFKGGIMGWFAVTDAYEDGHGFGSISLGGLVPVKRMTGPEFDKGELQRYFSSLAICPPMLVNHPSLDWTAVGPLTLRVRDRDDQSEASVDLELSDEGRPVACHAERPRLVGKTIVPTPWSASGAEFREWEGLRVATHLEAAWHLPEGTFAYYRAQVKSFEILTG